MDFIETGQPELASAKVEDVARPGAVSPWQSDILCHSFNGLHEIW
jgi:hypothetical protein